MPAVEIIDRGRGPQLSTSRITVQDLFPYLQDHCTNAEIRSVMPTLTDEDIAVVERYVREHYGEVAERVRRAQEWTAEQIRMQRERFPPPEGTSQERYDRLKRLLEARRQETVSDQTTG